MHPAVELILNRMETNPDDFKGNSRWLQLINEYKKYFTEDETTWVMTSLSKLRMTHLQEKLFELLTDDTLAQTIKDNSAFGMAPVAMSGQPVQYANATTATKVATQEEIEELKLELQKIRLQQELDTELNKFHGISVE
jgi:hypothetical protein